MTYKLLYMANKILHAFLKQIKNKLISLHKPLFTMLIRKTAKAYKKTHIGSYLRRLYEKPQRLIRKRI